MSATEKSNEQQSWPQVHFRLRPDLHAEWKRKVKAGGYKQVAVLERLIKQWVRER
jgi:hypothetical protein